MFDLKAIEARADAAMPGPWHPCCQENENYTCGMIWGHSEESPICAVPKGGGEHNIEPARSTDAVRATQTFIAHARDDVPALVAEVRRQRDKIAELNRRAQLAESAVNKELNNLTNGTHVEFALQKMTRERNAARKELDQIKATRQGESRDAFLEAIANAPSNPFVVRQIEVQRDGAKKALEGAIGERDELRAENVRLQTVELMLGADWESFNTAQRTARAVRWLDRALASNRAKLNDEATTYAESGPLVRRSDRQRPLRSILLLKLVEVCCG